MINKFLRKINWPAYVIMAIIIALSSFGGVAIRNPLFENQDKVLHFFAFAVLAWTLALWIRPQRWLSHPWIYSLVVVVVVAVFGALDEYHQSFVPRREVSFYDWVADVSGAIAAVIVFRFGHWWKAFWRNDNEDQNKV
jgi:VanZ family protein